MASSYTAQAYDLMGAPLDDQFGPKRCTMDEALSKLEAGGLVAARSDEGIPVAVGRTKSGRLVVIQDTCPHDGGLLSTGFIEGERIVCSRHGWEFEVQPGHCSELGHCPQEITRK